MNSEENKSRTWKYAPVLVIVASIFLGVQTLNALKENRYIGGGVLPQNVISVTGEGEVFAAPDIATFSFGVMSQGKTVKEAQDLASPKIAAAIKSLKDIGIEEKDIQTSDFNAYPRYEYTTVACLPNQPCPPGKQNIVGYEVSQNIIVKVRNIDLAAKAVDAATSAGATNISGISFTIDDEDALRREARQKAIEEARDKAKELAKDLDVRLVRIVSFSEGGAYPMFYKGAVAMEADGRGGAGAPVPSIPTGENRIVSNVTITYEIR